MSERKWFEDLFDDLESQKNSERAAYMHAYMKNQFEFLGVSTPARKAICKKYLKEAATEKKVDFNFVGICYESRYREHQYVAVNYLDAVADYLKESDLPKVKNCIITKSWWDTIDGLDRIVGRMAAEYPAINKTLLAWSTDENIWLRRVAIDHQLDRKTKTNTELLEKIIVNNLNQKEFFINKAIGWSLREYSKTNPDWVADFIKRHKNGLAALSLREAAKYLPGNK